MYDALLNALKPGDLIITVNERLAAFLKQTYSNLTQETVHETPEIYALNTWLENTWKALGILPRLLPQPLTRWLWEDIIRTSGNNNFILPTIQIATQAMDAYHQLLWWDVPIEALLPENDRDHDAFYEWRETLEQRLAEQSALTASQLPQALIEHFDFENKNGAVTLVGFQEVPPIIQKLFSLIRNTHYFEPPENNHSNVIRTEAANAQAEIEAMAYWAHKTHTEDPLKKITCVVPNLKEERQSITTAFKRVFHSHTDPLTTDAIHPFNVSAGKRLIAYPLISTVMNALELINKPSFSADDLREVMQSPYVFSLTGGMGAAACLDISLRKKRLASLSKDTLMEIKAQAKEPTEQLTTLNTICLFLNNTPPDFLFPSEWADFFLNALQSLGFPGDQSLNSEEYQLIGQLISEFSSLSLMDDLTGRLSFNACLTQLRNQLHQTTFQAQTEHSNAPVQVLGLLEAAGLPFDHLWIMGLDDCSWPPQAKGNPFIPRHIQTKYTLPHYSSQHELNYCKVLQENLINQASCTVVSHARSVDQSARQASQLTQGFSETPITDIYAAVTEHPSPKLEYLTHNKTRPVQANAPLRGGSAVVSNQAACPFRALGIHRLDAEPAFRHSIGVSALSHGQCLHRALEIIWKGLKNQASLLALDEQAKEKLIESAIDTALSEESDKIPQRFYPIEKKRLTEQITEFLAQEKLREPFSVTMIEQSSQIKIDSHTINVRIDRVDTLSNKQAVVIDYKTQARAQPKKWLLDPPQQAQLPFYATHALTDLTIFGCVYTLINRSGVQYTGINSPSISGAFPGKGVTDPDSESNLPDWSAVTEHWSQSCRQLVSDFIAGKAEIKPDLYSRPCDYCQLKLLCRIEESCE